MTSPFIQIYDMSGVDAQELVLGLLHDMKGATVRPESSGPDRYVVIECDDPSQAHAIFTMVTSIDPGATLIHTTNGQAPEFTRRLEPELD